MLVVFGVEQDLRRLDAVARTGNVVANFLLAQRP
jgi:hypothetical protein